MAQFNIIREGFLANSTTVTGSLQLSTDQIASLVDGDLSAPAITLSGTQGFIAEADFGSRYKIAEIRYYLLPTTASGVEIYTSTAGATYNLEALTVSGTYLSASGTTTSPRYVRLHHTVSGTGLITSSGIEFVVLNDDSIVDHLNNMIRVIKDIRNGIDTEELPSGMDNIRDEMLSDLQQFKYLLQFD